MDLLTYANETIIELKEEIEELKKENAFLKDKLNINTPHKLGYAHIGEPLF